MEGRRGWGIRSRGRVFRFRIPVASAEGCHLGLIESGLLRFGPVYSGSCQVWSGSIRQMKSETSHAISHSVSGKPLVLFEKPTDGAWDGRMAWFALTRLG